MTFPFDLRAEVELLLLAAQTHVRAEEMERVQILARTGIDWKFLLQSTVKHRVTPLVYRSLASCCEDSIPSPVLQRFRTHFRANGIRNELLAGRLLEVLRLFEKNGIDAIPFKGPILALSVYGGLALRDFGDIDVLVTRRDAAAAIDLLLAEGFRTRHQLSATEIAERLRSKGSLGFWSADGVVAVDVQWGITQMPYFSYQSDSEAFWGRLERFSIMGCEVPAIAREDLLQMLCVHGSRHCWERLAWVCDVAELLRSHEEMAWETVLGRAQEQGNLRTLFLGLMLANSLLGADVPEGILRRVHNDAVATSLAAELSRGICSPGVPFAATDRERVAFYFKLQDRLTDKIAYSTHVLRAAVRRRYVRKS